MQRVPVHTAFTLDPVLRFFAATEPFSCQDGNAPVDADDRFLSLRIETGGGRFWIE